ncbi:MAG TPA: YiiX family permuted papain-like enzyme [Chitinophaga sp.]|uniref:YiiX family permuted papain-like enzyme n=1 Tax=Chitinophaga sp. TaxID=1869181 RepID=UPI002CAE3216|nr:YiiX family permuted papain-like enzyme [Chitinophaga sp.]HVI49532.1 YiiX family permuted papain-like enzyme [Chitinophaga sp.]
MRTIMFVTLMAVVVTGHLSASSDNQQHSQPQDSIREGDIIFQESQSELSTAIQLATHSKYSHCGIILRKDGQLFVYEAIQPVQYTPLQEWVSRGKGGHYVIRRLKNEQLVTPAMADRMKVAGKKYEGKNYDFYFRWSDDRIYCSELVWKIYKQAAGIEIGTLQALKDFDLNSVAVKKQMKEIYDNNIPYEEMIISPDNMFHSELLKTVKEQ